MIFRFLCILFLVVITSRGALAEVPSIVADQDATAQELTQLVVSGDFQKATDKIYDLLGKKPGKKEVFLAELKQYDGYKDSVVDKVFDKSYGTSLRQIIYVTLNSDKLALYQNFTFKRWPEGWVLTQYTIDEGNGGLFPSNWKFGP